MMKVNKNGIKSSLTKTDRSKSRNLSNGSPARRVSFRYSRDVISRLDLIQVKLFDFFFFFIKFINCKTNLQI